MSKDLTDLLRQASGNSSCQPRDGTYQPRQLPNVPVLPPIPPRTGRAISLLPAASGGGASGVWMTADGIFTLVVD